MKYGTIFWLSFFIILGLLAILRKRISQKIFSLLLLFLVVLLLLPLLLPIQIFGRWNSISSLKGKTVSKILLQPSDLKWEINLVKSTQAINGKKEIDSIIYLLQRTEIYFLEKSTRVWEAKMTLITADNDSLEVTIIRKASMKTLVNTPSDEWAKDELGYYLEKLSNYSKPTFGETPSPLP